MKKTLLVLVALLLSAVCFMSCVPRQQAARSSSLDFLYPAGTPLVPGVDVKLQIPVRVGVAFAPVPVYGSHPINEGLRQELLGRITAAFLERNYIASLEVIPSTYLTPSGGFDNLDRVKAAFGIDLIVLVSYEQTQFTASTARSFAYWTVVGAYIIKGEKNDTSTVLEAVIYDIPSRALLFRAAGTSSGVSRATPLGTSRVVQEAANTGFAAATGDLIAHLEEGLVSFEEQIKTGTVRGVGTPAIQLVDESGAPVASTGGAGAIGSGELAVLAALAMFSWLAARRRGAQKP